MNLQLLIKTPSDFKHQPFLYKSFLYLLQLAEFDQEIVLRERARFYKNLLIKFTKKEINKENIYKNIYNYNDEDFENFMQNIKDNSISLSQEFLLNTPNVLTIKFNEEEFVNKFRIGSLSYLVKLSILLIKFKNIHHRSDLKSMDIRKCLKKQIIL